MIYRDFDIRANLCNKVGHKRYQFTVNGVVVHETDDASMYDAISGNEEDWDMEEYQNANGAAEYILGWLQDMYGGVGLKILRGLLGSPNKLPTVMEYTYLLNDYAELEKITTEQARSIVGLWTCEQWLEYYKVSE
jgi:hypothetical protein